MALRATKQLVQSADVEQWTLIYGSLIGVERCAGELIPDDGDGDIMVDEGEIPKLQK